MLEETGAAGAAKSRTANPRVAVVEQWFEVCDKLPGNGACSQRFRDGHPILAEAGRQVPFNQLAHIRQLVRVHLLEDTRQRCRAQRVIVAREVFVEGSQRALIGSLARRTQRHQPYSWVGVTSHRFQPRLVGEHRPCRGTVERPGTHGCGRVRQQRREAAIEQVWGVLIQKLDRLQHDSLVRAAQEPNRFLEHRALVERHRLMNPVERHSSEMAAKLGHIGEAQAQRGDQPHGDQDNDQGCKGCRGGVEHHAQGENQDTGERVADPLDTGADKRLRPALEIRRQRKEQQFDR